MKLLIAPLLPRRMSAMLLLIGLLLSACGYKSPSVGQEDLLIMVISEEDRPLLEPLLLSIFGREIATPAGESIFKVKIISPLEFERYQKHHNLVVASIANPADETGDILTRKLLGEERSAEAQGGGNPIFVADDFLARGQMFMGLLALDAIHAQKELTRLSDWIFNQFESKLRFRQIDVMYHNGDNHLLTDSLQTRYDYTMKLEPDYLRIKERPESQFVWLGRGYPYRWLSTHWLENADTIKISKQMAWKHMTHIAEDLFGTIFIDSLFRSEEFSLENGHNIFILRGVWGHKEDAAGGPFVTYLFRDREQHRIYMLTGLIFHPGGSKGLLIKRQEVMMRSFHTFDKPPGPRGDSHNLTQERLRMKKVRS